MFPADISGTPGTNRFVRSPKQIEYVDSTGIFKLKRTYPESGTIFLTQITSQHSAGGKPHFLYLIQNAKTPLKKFLKGVLNLTTINDGSFQLPISGRAAAWQPYTTTSFRPCRRGRDHLALACLS